MAVQCIRALHSRAFLPYFFFTLWLTNELTTLFSFSRARRPIQVPGVGAKLAASRTGPGRVLWMSSLAAHAHTFDADDWHLVKSTMPYEASKFQMGLIRAELSRRAGPFAQVRHFAVHPGAVDSSISAALDSGLLAYVKIFTCVSFFFACTKCVRLGFQLKSGAFLAGSVVWQSAPQHLSMEWRHRCRLHLLRSAYVYSGLVICRWGARYARE